MFPQHLGDPEDEIRGGCPVRKRAGESEADDLREQHVDRLADHDRLGLDAAHTPANDPEAVDHRRMRVGADKRVRIESTGVVPDDLGQVLEVDLMHDSRGRRHDMEVVEGRLSPLEELVSLHVPRELHLGVDPECVRRVERIDLDRVIDNEIGRNLGIDLRSGGFITGHSHNSGPHRSEIDHSWNAREVLQNDPGGLVGDLRLPHLRGVVTCHGMNVSVGNHATVVVSERRFEKNFDRVRQRFDAVEGIESVDHSLTERSVDRAACSEGIVGIGHGAASQTSRGRCRVDSYA